MNTQHKFGRLASNARLSSNANAALSSLYGPADRSGDALARQSAVDAMCGHLANAKASRLARSGYARAIGLGVALGVAGSILLTLGGCSDQPLSVAYAKRAAVATARKSLEMPLVGRTLNAGVVHVDAFRLNSDGSYDVCGTGYVPMSVDPANWTVHVMPDGSTLPATVGEFTRGECGPLDVSASFAPTVAVPCEQSGLADIPGACKAS